MSNDNGNKSNETQRIEEAAIKTHKPEPPREPPKGPPPPPPPGPAKKTGE